jgi:hypothetical protein
MSVEFGFTDELVNTQYAPLAAIFVRYHANQVLQALEQVQVESKVRDFNTTSKLLQLLVSILAGCDTLSEVNSKLKQETAWPLPGCTFCRSIELVSLAGSANSKAIEQFRTATTQIGTELELSA